MILYVEISVRKGILFLFGYPLKCCDIMTVGQYSGERVKISSNHT